MSALFPEGVMSTHICIIIVIADRYMIMFL